jgi:WhiB family transcriptional regulator, redox-sensing transcriptional regulator
MPSNQDWRTEANCRDRDPEIFFPASNNDTKVGRAKAICAACPVSKPCLEFAESVDKTKGIWGGVVFS